MQEIKDTLLEVRKAYRFLYNYQKRILDLVSYVGQKYLFTYNGGYPKFSRPAPINGGGKLENWAWDWLNLYFYEFNFKPKEISYETTLYFSIFIVNDTGFFDARDKDNSIIGIGKLDTDLFNSVEESQSKLIFVVGKNMWEGWGFDWDEKEFISEKEGQKVDNNNGMMVFKHYPLEKFADEEGAMYCIQDFQNFCLQKGIKLDIKQSISD